MNMLTISGSPHLHSDNSTRKIMFGVVVALLPAMLVAVYYFGLGALEVIVLSVFFSVFFEWLIQKYLIKGPLTITDGSAVVTGILLAFNVPSNLPWWMVIIGALVAIGIGKMSFGGLGKNIFNPALVSRVFLLVSFPVAMTSWPKPHPITKVLVDTVTGPTPLGYIKEGLGAGKTLSELIPHLPSYAQQLMGQMGGSLGEVSALAILLGGIYMLWKKIITWEIPVSMLLTVFVFSGILWLINPQHYMDPVFNLLTGGVMLGAVFMATDMVTSPMTRGGQLLFGFGIGLITMLIRVWGAYPEGVSFAILLMNSVVPLINRGFKPRRFGKVKAATVK
ncbi:RnfABCDGE type electron transport complex subunit D [Candidatus Sulfidibacterium hydrothermale]|uniref:RnfABCDGE type electron transport complex subunit D n=1 Tax=Candidatus Sulfidibacterium hydrothermale TaxID=2875962 RepID=UPI001F0A788D|nr:RnfABCDGE type electron transport complex subunit D [Candidatus Sulfidibacterium hydrothermale]UBM61649.1 RnfABCDGE type electron transport complex subunit D [Candidatus Sulfidibacterium hydrothermale]